MKEYIYELPTPYYVVEEGPLIENLKLLQMVQEKSGCKILLAQKAFSMFSLYPLIARYLKGTACSGLYEARLGYEEFGGETHIYSPGYQEKDFAEILRYCDHIVFNSFSQWQKFGAMALSAGKSCGLRINPECSTQKGHEVYDPCAPNSRLGMTKKEFDSHPLTGITGLHMHTLCEQNAEDLLTTLHSVEKQFSDGLQKVKWLNLGGGHHITRGDYDVDALIKCILRLKKTYGIELYLEPGEAVALNTGYLVTTVLDVVHNGMDILILDTSAACHMPDILEMPYRPEITGAGKPGEKPFTYRLAGPTCLAGDIIGDYSFDRQMEPGDRLIFHDMAHYTMVKNNTFNGMPLPAIALYTTDGQLKLIKEFHYDDFKERLS